MRRLDEAKIRQSISAGPVFLLEFLTDHISLNALRSIYTIILKNYRIGRKIPKLINRANASGKLEIHGKCVEAAKSLSGGDPDAFAKQVAKNFSVYPSAHH